MQNTKSTTGVICNANDDIFHVIFVLCKNQNSLYVKQNIFSTGKKKREKNLVTQKFVDINKIYQVHNQEFFRIMEFSWNQGTFIKIHLQHKKEKPRKEKIPNFFCLEILKKCILNEKFYP